ncbi:MAG: hypothetical protein IJM74_03490 [Bacteroidales bacterium]|nr:hypothetical protein [Bacteroidales bacterium]MBQ7711643.1 hypothetical protein [Bacteroidales bacterium]
MKKRIFRYNWALCVVVVLLSACNKDDEQERVSFALSVADRYSSDSKVWLNGYQPVFAEDEEVWINGETYLIDTRSGSTAVYDVAKAGSYRAVFPASWVSGIKEGAPLVTFPDMQVYRTDGIHQLVENPMVAYASGSASTLNFYNVASLVTVNIHNGYGKALKIKYVAIYTDIAPLSGTASITGFAGNEPEISVEQGITNVSIDCSSTESLADGGTLPVTLAIPPINEGVKLYVDVYMTGVGDDAEGKKKYSFTRDTRTNKTIARNQIGVINVNLANDEYTHECGLFWGSGNNEKDPYIIMDKTDLGLLRALVKNGDATYNDPGKHFLQTAHIDISDSTSWSGIGTSTHPFVANYDGSCASVKLGITSVSGPTGIFGCVGGGGATIKNLYAKGSITNDAAYAAGGICGEIVGSITIDSCYNEANITGQYASSSADHNVGGIVGKISGDTVTVSHCINKSTASLTKKYGYGGGIVGYVYDATSCTISQCKNLAALSTTDEGYLGGICGYVSAITSFSQDSNKAAVSGGSTNSIGGIVGKASVRTTFEYCGNTHAVSGGNSVGGFLGNTTATDETAGNETTFTSCKNSGAISGSGYDGGFVGQSTHPLIFTTDTNSGKISASGTCLGGFCGYSTKIVRFFSCGNTGKNLTTSNEDYDVYSSATTTSGETGVGGFVGKCAYTRFYNCTNSASINGNMNVGGFCGRTDNIHFDSCLNSGSIYGRRSGGNDCAVGGFIGYIYATGNTYSSINNSVNRGSVTGLGQEVGGFVGYQRALDSIVNCYNIGSVSGANAKNYAGGIAGYIKDYNCYIINCYVKINSTTSSCSGSVYGIQNSTYSKITLCYANSNHGASSNNAITTYDEGTGALTAGQTVNGATRSTLYDALHNWHLANDTYSDWKTETVPHLNWEPSSK